jgi:hypothetical protein
MKKTPEVSGPVVEALRAETRPGPEFDPPIDLAKYGAPGFKLSYAGPPRAPEKAGTDG